MVLTASAGSAEGALRRAALWMEQSPAVPADMDAVKDWWQAVAS